MSYFNAGQADARNGQFFAYSLPPGHDAQSEVRVTYRAGFIAWRIANGRETAPALIAEQFGNGCRYYWIVAIDKGTPIYNVTNGDKPATVAGYRDLKALMCLKGDCLT